MKSLNPSRYALTSCVAIALLAGCGGSQPPIGAPGATLQSRTIATHADRGKSWMLPEAKSEDLLYAADERAGSKSSPGGVDVFSYPRGKLVGVLLGFDTPMGECVDAAGDVYVTNYGTGNIVEYAHGGSTPINTLYVDGGNPLGCSVDSRTGNLAVSYQGGNLAVWTSAQGTPTIYNAPYQLGYCGYDSNGNLFVNSTSDNVALLELPVGSGSLRIVSLNKKLSRYAGQVQWDGKYVTLQELHWPSTIYRVEVSGSTGTIVGKTTFSGISRMVGASWIQKKSVLIPYGLKRNELDRIGDWRYPIGGDATGGLGHLKRGATGAFHAVTVSVAPP